MTLEKIAHDIRGFGHEWLEKFGLTVVPVESDDPESTDHAISFRDAAGLEHVVSVQVSALSPAWKNTSMTVEHTTLDQIEGTDFKLASAEWFHHGFQTNSRVQRVEEIMEMIAAHNRFTPVDDLDAGIVTDTRIPKIIARLRTIFGEDEQGSIRLKASSGNGACDTIELLSKSDVLDFRVEFHGRSGIRVTYPTLAGDTRVLEYDHLGAFNRDFDKDIGCSRRSAPASEMRL